jgi:hypothetical protein
MPIAIFLVPLVGSLLALVCLVSALRVMRRYRLMQDLPTSKASGVFIGLVELTGTAEAERPLVSYLAGATCVYYSWNVAERWSRIVHETYRDSDGKTKTRTRHESGWTTVAEGGESIPFYLRDDTGVIRVRPEQATIHATEVFGERCDRSDELYYDKGPQEAVSDSDGVRRFTEQAIPLHAALYVVGQARERQDVVAAEIAHDEHAPMFLISMKDEAHHVSRSFWSLLWLVVLGLVLCGGAFFLFERMVTRRGPGVGWVVAAGAYLVAAGVAWLWTVYNGLVSLRNRVRHGWATIEVQLKRRRDLIPGLVEIVSELGEYEKVTQTALVELRNQLVATPPDVAGPDYAGVSAPVRGVSERYPQISAQPAFLNMQRELVDTEQRIALARGYYNEIVSYWNTRLGQFPDGVVAWLAGMRRQAYLEARGFERKAVEVKLAE